MDPKVEKSSDLEQQGLWGGDTAGRGEAWRSQGGVTGATLRGEGAGVEHRGPPSDGHMVDTAPGHEAQGRWSLLEGSRGLKNLTW